MYFATDSGLYEYDGTHWKPISADKIGFARSLDSDDNGVIVGGNGEFGYLASDATGETVYHSLSERLDITQHPFSNVWSVHATSHGAYFITDSFIFRWYQDRLDVIESPTRSWGFNAYDDVFLLNRVDTTVSRLHNGKIEQLPQTDQIIKKTGSGRVTIQPYPNGKLLITTSDNGSFIYHLDRLKNSTHTAPILLEKFITEADKYFAELNLYHPSDNIDNKQYIYPTVNGAIIIMNTDGSLQQILNKQNGLDGQIISSVFVDNRKNLWATTLKGIFHIKLNSPMSLYNADEIDSFIITSLIHEDKIYITSHKGIFYLENQDPTSPNGHEFVRVKGTVHEQSFPLLSTNDRLYAASQNKIYAIKGSQARKLLALEDNPVILSLQQSNRFPNYIFIGTYSTGVNAMRINANTNTVTAKYIDLDIPVLKAASIRRMQADKNGDIWIETDGIGIYHIRFNSDDIHDYTLHRYDKQPGFDPVPQKNIFSKVKDNIIISTPETTYQTDLNFGPKKNKVRFIPDPVLTKYLSSKGNTPKRIQEYGEDLFISDGVSQFGVLKKESDHIYQWQTDRFKPFSDLGELTGDIHIDDKKNIWIPLSSTLYKLDPKIEKDYQLDFPAYIRRVYTNTSDILFNGNHLAQPLAQQQKHSSNITAQQPDWATPQLDYAQNAVTFEYSATFYEHNDQLSYSYILEGFDKQWSPWSSDNKKAYTNLPEGHYTFYMKAKNAYDHISETDTYQFYILPPWYRTIWMYLVYSIAFLLLVTLCVRVYTWRLIQARKNLKAMVRLRTAELQQSLENLKATQDELAEASHRAGMADVARSVLHNVGNSLTTIKTASGLSQDHIEQLKDINKLDKVADLIQKTQENGSTEAPSNAKIQQVTGYLRELTRVLNTRRDNAAMESQRMQASIQEIEKLLYEQKNYVQAGDFNTEVNIQELINHTLETLNLSSDDDSISIEQSIPSLPPLKLQKYKLDKILNHLLNQAIKAVEQSERQDKTISIEVELKEDKQLEFCISDNGIGINGDAITYIFNRDYEAKNDNSGYDLHQCSNAASEMGGTLTASSDGIGTGTKFILQLPIQI